MGSAPPLRTSVLDSAVRIPPIILSDKTKWAKVSKGLSPFRLDYTKVQNIAEGIRIFGPELYILTLSQEQKASSYTSTRMTLRSTHLPGHEPFVCALLQQVVDRVSGWISIWCRRVNCDKCKGARFAKKTRSFYKRITIEDLESNREIDSDIANRTTTSEHLIVRHLVDLNPDCPPPRLRIRKVRDVVEQSPGDKNRS